jgi:formylglycine-generating enzyme required for sulfatase activity
VKDVTSKFALVIANTEYEDASFAKLTAPGRDAEEFAQILRELAAFDEVQVLLNEGEGKTRRSIARFFAERKRDDLLLLYFSGHGIRNEQGQLFLAANDTEINILEASGIPADFVTNSMNNSRSQRQLLILDCCNSGAFAHGSKSASAVGKSMGIATAFEGSGFGRVVLTATDATQYAWEGDKVIGDTQKSVFTHFLVEGLKGEADRNGDGRIDVDELYDYAYEQVVSRTPKQTPGKWSYKQQGDIVLRENLKPREVKSAPLPPELLEMLSHPNSGVRRAGIQELTSLLDGKHLGLARAAEEKLREIVENDDSLTLRRSASDLLIAHGFISEPPVSIPVEASKKEPTAEKKIEKPARRSAHPAHIAEPSQKEQIASVGVAPRAFPELKGIPSRLNLRFLGLIVGAVLAIIALVLVVKSNFFAPKLGIGSTMISEKDGMVLVYVPAGEFTMGSNEGDSDEQPVHTVALDAFWIDKSEVTNAMYVKCVNAGACNPPTSTSSYARDSYYGNSEFDNYPVIYVSWNDAKAYCKWADRRLPTEAEWEKAARWNDAMQEKYTYPWGNDPPMNDLLNYRHEVGDTTEVGAYPQGASPYGALDMAGNVWEWVSSFYRPYPYDANDGREILDSSTEARVLRGGSWTYADVNVRSADRFSDDPASTHNGTGFRCARSGKESAQLAPLGQVVTDTPPLTQTSQPVKANTPSPTETTIPSTPSPTKTIVSPTQTSEYSIGSTITGKDGMILLYVPAGEFTMGSDANSSYVKNDQRPSHQVFLDAFWIDQTEVTNQMFSAFIESTGYQTDAEKAGWSYVKTSNIQVVETSGANWLYPFGPSSDISSNQSYRQNYPVTQVSWNDAVTYCNWVGRRLPSEAEWEKAGRGTDERNYPWGNTFPNDQLVNAGKYGMADGSKTVGSYPDGAGPYGAYEMVGNVAEWVYDWYDAYPNGNTNNAGYGQINRVVRGGWWETSSSRYATSLRRDAKPPLSSYYYIGFRCAMSATP